jgi:hypothetical protein
MTGHLLEDGPVVVNIGLRAFASELEAQQVPVVHVDWTPAPHLDAHVTAVLDALS